MEKKKEIARSQELFFLKLLQPDLKCLACVLSLSPKETKVYQDDNELMNELTLVGKQRLFHQDSKRKSWTLIINTSTINNALPLSSVICRLSRVRERK